MKMDPNKRDMTKYCDFHRDHGHRTDDCIQLKKEIEFLIRCGHLRRYVAPEDWNRAPPPPPRQPTPAQYQQPPGEINVISRGLADGGESISAKKAYLRIFRPGETLEVQAVSKLPRLDILGPLPIGKGQCKFAIVGVDYFTKWAEAEPLGTITEQKVHNFV